MKRLAVAVSAACLGWLTGALWPTHAASAACTQRTAWFGAEENSLSNGQRTVTWPVPYSITVTSVTLSASLAPFGGGFNEALYLVGFAAPGTSPWNGVDSPDPTFGASSGYGTGFHGNEPQNSILASAILKSTAGRDANQAVQAVTQTTVPGGERMFLAMGVAGPALSDMEAQVEVSYLPAGC